MFGRREGVGCCLVKREGTWWEGRVFGEKRGSGRVSYLQDQTQGQPCSGTSIPSVWMRDTGWVLSTPAETPSFHVRCLRQRLNGKSTSSRRQLQKHFFHTQLLWVSHTRMQDFPELDHLLNLRSLARMPEYRLLNRLFFGKLNSVSRYVSGTSTY